MARHGVLVFFSCSLTEETEDVHQAFTQNPFTIRREREAALTDT